MYEAGLSTEKPGSGSAQELSDTATANAAIACLQGNESRSGGSSGSVLRAGATIEESTGMPTKPNANPREIYQIKVTLLGARPPIWRRLLVPANLTFEDLHDVLQLAMEWQECHMHDFRVGQRRFGTPDPDEKLMGLPDTANERTARLSSVLGRVGAKAVYTYDFGDGWEHAIVVEKILPPDAEQAYPMCVGGKRHAPPEDCGGVPGFYNMLEAIGDPEHDEYEEMRDWLGDEFDPEAFSVDEVNRRLAQLRRHRGNAEL